MGCVTVYVRCPNYHIPHTTMSLPAKERRSCHMRSSQVFLPERSKMMRCPSSTEPHKSI